MSEISALIADVRAPMLISVLLIITIIIIIVIIMRVLVS